MIFMVNFYLNGVLVSHSLSYFICKDSQGKQMKKRIEIIMAVLLLLGACFFARESVHMVDNLKAQTGEVCIVIDAGHGGDDPQVHHQNDPGEERGRPSHLR